MNTDKPSIWSIVSLAFTLSITGLTIGGCKPSSDDYVAPPPPTVTVSQPVQRNVMDYIEFTGMTEAVQIVEIRARVKGFLQSSHFKAGTDVKKDDLLYVIDPKSFQAQVNKAQADLNRRIAELELAQANYRRYETLYRKRTVSEVKLAEAKAARDTAKADIEAARAVLEEARLDLSYTRVRAPISGRVGRNLVSVGNLVGSGESTHLTTIVQYNPVWAYFSVNERDLLRLRQKAHEKKGRAKQKKGRRGVIHLRTGE